MSAMNEFIKNLFKYNNPYNIPVELKENNKAELYLECIKESADFDRQEIEKELIKNCQNPNPEDVQKIFDEIDYFHVVDSTDEPVKQVTTKPTISKLKQSPHVVRERIHVHRNKKAKPEYEWVDMSHYTMEIPVTMEAQAKLDELVAEMLKENKKPLLNTINRVYKHSPIYLTTGKVTGYNTRKKDEDVVEEEYIFEDEYIEDNYEDRNDEDNY